MTPINEKLKFDIWASEYDADVLDCDARGVYPFAGYKSLMSTVYERVTANEHRKVLDIGIGTGFLSSKLAAAGCEIWGVDFSDEMLQICAAKLPNAKLFKADFSDTLPDEIVAQKFDYIISTYALHHLTTEQKVEFVRRNVSLLNENGEMIIGDISFNCAADLSKCKSDCGDAFDNEFYWIADEMLSLLPEMKYEKLSNCAGIYRIPEIGV